MKKPRSFLKERGFLSVKPYADSSASVNPQILLDRQGRILYLSLMQQHVQIGPVLINFDLIQGGGIICFARHEFAAKEPSA